MKITKINRWLIGAALLLAGCTGEDITTGGGQDTRGDDPTGMPVLFSVGVDEKATTRAAVPYMEQTGRFVCTMYYHAKEDDTDESDFDIKDVDDGGTMGTSWLIVNNAVGNSVYRKPNFSDPTNDGDNPNLGFDFDANIFYWRNRKTHAFLALADYNKLKTNVGTTTNTEADRGKLKMYPNYDKDFNPVTLPDEPTEEETAAYNTAKLANGRYANTYDLTKGELTGISGQPDPILALTVMKPVGATREANRVSLYFKHQFSQIQVNLKDGIDNSANITADKIEKVELLGVSETGYVFTRLNANGTVGSGRKPDEDILDGSAIAEDVNYSQFTDEQLANNKWGTSFVMFDMTKGDHDGDGLDDGYPLGYLKSFNAIAFGYLRAIRVTWHETSKGAADNIEHVSTFEIEKNVGADHVKLQSGVKYVYDLELRRGTLAVIRAQILNWSQKSELVYPTDGTIID